MDNFSIISKNFLIKEEAENFVLEIAEKNKIKKYKIINKNTGEIISQGEDL